MSKHAEHTKYIIPGHEFVSYSFSNKYAPYL